MKELLAKCGITTYLTVSDWFSTFTPDLLVVHSTAYVDTNTAKLELEKAKACGVNGFTKKAKMSVPGPGED